MRIFVLGAGATGSLLAQLLERQGHTVWCGDRDPERARRFLGKKSTIAVTKVNARNLRGIVKCAKGCQLIVNASASVFNEIVLRAALRLRAHYVDLSSQWSPEVSFDEAVSHPRIYRNGRFQLGKRFSEIEKFRFADPIGTARVVLAAQDEVATLPHHIPMRDLDVKIGGNEIDRLRRWHKQGKLSRSRGMTRQRFPQTSSPRMIAKLIRQGILQNARFAAAVLVKGVKRGKKEDQHLLIRSDCMFPTLYQIRQQGRYTTPVAYATAHVAALFIKFLPRDLAGVFAPEMLPAETRRAVLAGLRNHNIRITHKTTVLKHKGDDDEEF